MQVLTAASFIKISKSPPVRFCKFDFAIKKNISFYVLYN